MSDLKFSAGHLGKGSVEVICGPMFSGKTEELIRRLVRARIARQQIMVFKPKIDNRYDASRIVSHSRRSIFAVPVSSIQEIEDGLSKKTFKIDVVGLDEAQFFQKSIKKTVEQIAQKNIRVIVAGLDQDYLGEPFGPMPELLAIADQVTKQCAVCVVCGASATKTQRVRKSQVENVDEPLVLVGATDTYEARCRMCHMRSIDVPKARPLPKDEELFGFGLAAEGQA